MTNFNLALKLAIVSSRKKQKRIARLARVDEQQLSHYVHRRRKPSLEEADRISRVLEKQVADLFEPEDIIRGEVVEASA